MPQENPLNQPAQTQTSEQSLEANQSVLTPEQTAFIEEKISVLKDNFGVLDSDKSTPKDKKDAKEEVIGIINEILSNSELGDVSFAIQTEADKTTQKIVMGAIKQLKLPALAEGASEEDQTDKQAKLEAVVKELTGIKQELGKMGPVSRAGLLIAGVATTVGLVTGVGLAFQNNMKEGAEIQDKVVKMVEGNAQRNSMKVANFEKSGRLIVKDLGTLNGLLGEGSSVQYVDVARTTVILTPEQVSKLLSSLGITATELDVYATSQDLSKFTTPAQGFFNKGFDLP